MLRSGEHCVAASKSFAVGAANRPWSTATAAEVWLIRAVLECLWGAWICAANWCRPSQTRASGARTLDPASGGFGSAERQGFRYSFGVHLVHSSKLGTGTCFLAAFSNVATLLVQRERAASLGPGFLSPTHLPPFQGEIGKPGLEEWGCLDMGESSSQPFRGRFRQSVSSDYVCLGVVFHS